MTFLGLLIGLVTLLGAGFGATVLLLRRSEDWNLFEAIALSWLFGTGIVSLLLWLGGLVLSGMPLQIGIFAIAAGLTFAGFRIARQHKGMLSFPKPQHPIEWVLGAAIAAEIAVMIYSAFGHGLGWDGLLNWEVKARYGFENDGVIPATYYASETRAFTHPGYPLLVPLTELWLYLSMGEAHQFWIKIIFPLYYAAGAVLLASVATRLTNQAWAGLTASALMFFVPHLTNSPGTASGGYVDVPLSVIYLTAIGYLMLYAKNGESHACRVFAVGLALLPWAKREGAILWAIAAAAAVVVLWQRRASWRTFLWLVPGPLILVSWKSFLHLVHAAEPRDFVAITLPNIEASSSRLPVIAKLAWSEVMETYHWSLFWPIVAVAFVSLAFRWRERRSSWLLFASVVLPIALYAGTYVFSVWPDYTLHLQASFSRLLLHVVPLGCLAIALALPWRRHEPHEAGKA